MAPPQQIKLVSPVEPVPDLRSRQFAVRSSASHSCANRRATAAVRLRRSTGSARARNEIRLLTSSCTSRQSDGRAPSDPSVTGLRGARGSLYAAAARRLSSTATTQERERVRCRSPGTGSTDYPPGTVAAANRNWRARRMTRCHHRDQLARPIRKNQAQRCRRAAHPAQCARPARASAARPGGRSFYAL